MSDLYDADILLWSEQQAELLRSRAVNALDWDNLAEEIVDVGRSELRAVASHLVQALLHDLKAEAWPLARDVPHWRAEARGQRDDARAGWASGQFPQERPAPRPSRRPPAAHGPDMEPRAVSMSGAVHKGAPPGRPVRR